MSHNGLFLFPCLILLITMYVYCAPPWKMPNVTNQCRAIRGKKFVGACLDLPRNRSDICKELYCAVNYDEGIIGIYVGPPLEGTKCEYGKVCMAGKCTKTKKMPKYTGPPAQYACINIHKLENEGPHCSRNNP